MESPVAPSRAVAPTPTASTIILSAQQTVTPLERLIPLAEPITVSQTVGVLGGVIAIPAAGVTVVVPAFALSTTTTISVTARKGSNVAYEFEPHGLTFNVPLVMTQKLTGTQAQTGGLMNPLSLYVGYFPSSASVTSVTELLNVGLGLQGQLAVTNLWHFSGYIFAGGRSAEDE